MGNGKSFKQLTSGGARAGWDRGVGNPRLDGLGVEQQRGSSATSKFEWWCMKGFLEFPF